MKHIPLLLIIVLLVSCNMGKSGKSQDNEKPVIAVTIEPQRYFTEAIAGDKFDVISIVPGDLRSYPPAARFAGRQ